MKLLKLRHETDPRYLRASDHAPPPIITQSDLAFHRFGRLMIAEVGEVVAEYERTPTGDWMLFFEKP